MEGSKIRQVMLEVISEYSNRVDGSIQSGGILDEVARRLDVRNDIIQEQAILTFWYDLFRSGHLSWGYNLPNPNPPFCHLTTQGRKALEHYSRDPFNPDGYLIHLNTLVELDAISQSYIEEALKTYNSDCLKATAVMVGAATENIVLQLRDTLVSRMKSLGHTVPSGLNDWRIKRVLDSFEKELEKKKNDMPNQLSESFGVYWPAFAHQIRTVRNEAGHPINVDKVTQEAVHAALLIFPELAKLGSVIKEWIKQSYTYI